MSPDERRSILAAIAETHGTPSYVYFLDEVQARVAALRSAFGARFEISYAVKSNPNPGLLARLAGVVDALDVSSGGELALAIEAGWAASKVSFTGPAKRAPELVAAVRHGTGEVVVESVSEARELDAVAGQAGVVQDVLVRIAPSQVPKGFGDSMAGKPVAFGIDEEVLAASLDAVAACRNLRLRGFHIYSGTQCLQADAIVANYRIFLGLFERASEHLDIVPTKLIFGAGIGIPYHANQESVDLEEVARHIVPELDAFKAKARYADAELVLETGRYLVGEAGVLLTRVVRTKTSRGGEIGICDAGMNNQLAAAGHFGMVIKRNYPIEKIASVHAPGEPRPYLLTGPLCTSIDTIGRGVTLDGLEANDLLGIGCSGAYGLTSSPMYFISHPLPREFVVEGDAAAPTVTEVTRPFGGYP
ncbi:MAG: hypothetical protein WBG86_08405 [Polyangiales bacterium]